jgi:putative endonuclease
LNKRGQGFKYENLAKFFLINNGLEFIRSNYYSEYGEIDLIFKEDEALVFVEVKYRKNNSCGFAEESVTKSKLNKIIKTSLNYICENNWIGGYRYDMVAINGEEIIWVKNLV